jgi:soluble lytic murein transglycosylase-like protein
VARRATRQTAGIAAKPGRRPTRRGGRRIDGRLLARHAVEAAGLFTAAVVGVIAALGRAADALTGTGLWSHLVPFAAIVLGIGIVAALGLRLWFAARAWLVARGLERLPATLAAALGTGALLCTGLPAFRDALASVRRWVGGAAEAQRTEIAHQVYAAYRRADASALLRVLERERVYEATVHEAAVAFAIDPEVLTGLAATESAFNPRDSSDGGRGLFQITAPPGAAVAEARRRLGGAPLDPLNQRHNAFLAAATLRLYLDQMAGDLFLGLLAYNIGPRNGGLVSIMRQYGARDFVTIQPYLQNLPRDYPIRVLSAALAYRLWRAEGTLPRYEDGDNARRIQAIGIPGLDPAAP